MPWNLIELAAAARRDPTLLPNHLGTVDRKIREEIQELDNLMKEVWKILMSGDAKDPAHLQEMYEKFSREKAAYEEALTAYTHPTAAELGVKSYNPRYLEYCEAHGHAGDPEGQLAADRERYPGGCMCGYILWATSGRKAPV